MMSRRLLSGAWNWARASLTFSPVTVSDGLCCSTQLGTRSVCAAHRASNDSSLVLMPARALGLRNWPGCSMTAE